MPFVDVILRYCTFKVTVAVWESTPEESTAFTVTVKVPRGVPGSGGGPLLPPPPQAVIVVREAKRTSARTARRLREAELRRKRPAKIPPDPVAQKLSGVRLAVFGAVVLIDSVVLPLPTTDAAEKVQALSAGRPVQEAAEKLTVLL
jgi:hypothetical protein